MHAPKQAFAHKFAKVTATSPTNIGRVISRIFLIVAVAITFQIAPPFSNTNPGLFVTEAQAQVPKPRKRRNIFNLLFGKRGSLSRRNRVEPGQRVKINPNKRVRRAAAPAPVPKVEKNEDALKILVAGDFMADGVAWGLTRQYADNANVVVVSVAKGLSGFVRDDVKDWPAEIGSHIDEIKPRVVVFLSGMNDRQQMRLPTGRVAKLSEAWTAAYNERTQKLAKSIKEKGVPLIWVGLPPVNSSKMSSDYLVFNEIYRSKAAAEGFAYVDVWDGFTNAEGQFVSAGPDVNGQIKRLRASDGINMTKTGKAKLAFYVEKELRQFIGIGDNALFASLPNLQDAKPSAPEYDPAKSGKTIVYSLAGSNLDGGGELEGVKIDGDESTAAKSVSFDLVSKGVTPRTHRGRIDYYGVDAHLAKAEQEKEEDQKKADANKSSEGGEANKKPATLKQ